MNTAAHELSLSAADSCVLGATRYPAPTRASHRSRLIVGSVNVPLDRFLQHPTLAKEAV